MKRKIVFLLAIVLIVASCKKNEDLTVTLKQSGKLSVKITDGSNVVIPNVNVKLYNSYRIEKEDTYIEALKTNADGFVDFGEVNAGTYVVALDTPKVNGIKYMPYKVLQLVSGTSKAININVQEFVGTMNLTILNGYVHPSVPYSNINVILVPAESLIDGMSIKAIISKAEYSGKTNSLGNISFITPSNRRYYLFIHNDLKTLADQYPYSIELEKDQVRKFSFYASF